MINRRNFPPSALGGAVSVPTAGSRAAEANPPARASAQFKLKYAPHFGMFKEHAGDDLVDRIRFVADEGLPGKTGERAVINAWRAAIRSTKRIYSAVGRIEDSKPALIVNRRRSPFRFTLLVLALIHAAWPTIAAPSLPPNIIVIMADDMGYSDLGCYGSEIETPNLDSLAKNGVRFTQFYNTGRCCPTRASLLTGLYQHQAGVGNMVSDEGREGYRGDLNRRCVTIAEALKPAGYRTYMSGKWHLTKHSTPRREADKYNWPSQRGFDRFYGTLHGAGSFFDPHTLSRDNTPISPFADPEYQPKEFYYTDAINDQAARFVAEHARDHASQPFFLYVAHTAPHWPLHAKESDIAKYKGKYDAGYDAIREARVTKMKALGLLDPKWKVTPQAGGKWSEVPNRSFELRCMEAYAAMIDCMDQGTGRLIAELKRTGQFDRTLIFFLQDNGGCAERNGRGGDAQLHADRPTLPSLAADYIQKDMIPKQTRDGYPVRRGYGVLPGESDTFLAYGQAWANVSNTPFRGFKHDNFEGGSATPLIAHWPAGIQATRRGALEPQPGHLIDIMATCVELAGAPYPKERDGEAIYPLEGVSLSAAFAGKPLARKEPLFFEHHGNRAARDGRWKIVAKGAAGPWELYDMEADRTEINNLAARHPERMAKMAAQWEAWGHRAHVLPWLSDPPYSETAPARKTK